MCNNSFILGEEKIFCHRLGNATVTLVGPETVWFILASQLRLITSMLPTGFARFSSRDLSFMESPPYGAYHRLISPTLYVPTEASVPVQVVFLLARASVFSKGGKTMC